MWKKITITLLMLICLASFGFVYINTQMHVTGGTLNLLTRDTSSNGNGNRFVLGKYNGNEVVFELLKDGIAMVPGGVRRTTLCTQNCVGTTISYNDTTLYEVEQTINSSLNSIAKSALKRVVFNPTATEMLDGGVIGGTFGGSLGLQAKHVSDTAIVVKDCRVYNPHTCDTGLICDDRCSWDAVMLKQDNYTIPTSSNSMHHAPFYSGISSSTWNKWQYWGYQPDNVTIAYAKMMIKPAVQLDLNKIVFAVAGTPSSLSAIDNKNTNVVLKLRISDPSISAPSITDTAKKSYAKGDEIEVKYSGAIPGKNISALLFNTQTNEFSYYQSFLNQPASGTLKIKTDQFNIGDQYSIQLVNESVSNDNQPVGASSFSQSFEVEIIEQHKLAYTKQPVSGASAGIDYEYKKNVNEGDTIGRITVNPLGAVPLTYKIESNGGDNSYQNFEIDGLDANNASSAASLNVKIKVGGPNIYEGGLKVGEYKFCISAQDSNENPDVPNTSDQTKVCTSLTVEKPKLTIAFDDKNTTKKTVTEAATNWNETATVTPTPTPKDVKVTYTKVGGDIGLIDINPDTGEITYTGNVTFGKVKIRATADDKDKDQGVDNYDEVFTEKEIIIAQDLEGVVTPDTNSSDPNIPTFTATDTNVQTGGT
ncbi:MAG: hypothetical protein HFE68_06095, partial [Erysipelotrichaceae bacterium]|nr:hypothetical protein [Erysipelotrichaceae bacterium]